MSQQDCNDCRIERDERDYWRVKCDEARNSLREARKLADSENYFRIRAEIERDAFAKQRDEARKLAEYCVAPLGDRYGETIELPWEENRRARTVVSR